MFNRKQRRDSAFVFTFWDHQHPTEYWHNYRKLSNAFVEQPIIFSIASIRAVSPDVPIYVLDYAYSEQRWADWSAKLSIRVVPYRPYLEADWDCESPYQVNSKPFDIYNFARSIPEKRIVFSDSDIWWFDLEPFPSWKGLGMNQNSGIFCYNKACARSAAALETWQALVLLAIRNYSKTKDDELVLKIKRARGGPERKLSEEAVAYYLKQLGMTSDLDRGHNETYHGLDPAEIDPLIAKKTRGSLHFLRSKYGSHRAYYFTLFESFADKLRPVISGEDIGRLLGGSPEAGGYLKFSEIMELVKKKDNSNEAAL